MLCTQIERDFISKIGAGCSAPVACNAVVDENRVVFRVMLGYPDGTYVMEEKIIRDRADCNTLGVDMADMMIKEGALQLLKNAEKVAFKDEMPQRL